MPDEVKSHPAPPRAPRSRADDRRTAEHKAARAVEEGIEKAVEEIAAPYGGRSTLGPLLSAQLKDLVIAEAARDQAFSAALRGDGDAGRLMFIIQTRVSIFRELEAMLQRREVAAATKQHVITGIAVEIVDPRPSSDVVLAAAVPRESVVTASATEPARIDTPPPEVIAPGEQEAELHPADERERFAARLRDVTYDELNELSRTALTTQQRWQLDDEMNRRSRVASQDEPPSGAHDAELLARDESGALSRWDQSMLTRGLR